MTTRESWSRARWVVIAAALAAALVPLPPGLVESWYSRGFYPIIQRPITSLTNVSPIALIDVAALALLLFLVVVFWKRVRLSGLSRALTSSTVTLITLAAVLFLTFLAMWGLNYRRIPLEEKLDFDRNRLTPAAALQLGDVALGEVNGLHAAAHADAHGVASGVVSLEAAFATAQGVLGATRLAVPGVPKRSLLERYFRVAAIDGMTDPFFLEVVVNPDTLPFERPFVLAHEWAHLAGYADESEANLVAWLTCSRGDAMARYSGWLTIFEHVVASLPRNDRARLTARLGEGPRRNLSEAAARYARSSPAVRTAARDVYDTYLRANRVSEGVASYSAVVQLLIGAGIADGQPLRLRR